MSQSLSRWQAALLGLVVLSAGGLAAGGLLRVAARQGLWAETTEVSVGFPEAHDVAPGTPVRVRGVDAGQVVAVDYPEADGPDAAVVVRLRLDARFAARLFADATAQIQPTGLLGQKVIAVRPGTLAAGPFVDGRLKPTEAPDVSQAAAKMSAVADEAAALLKDIRSADGTVSKLLKDDELYRDLKGLAADSAGLVKKADKAVGTVESEAGSVRELVADGRETLRSVRQGTDAMQKLPIVRGYVEDPVSLMARPDCRREAMAYNAADLFEPGTAILSHAGRDHLAAVVDWLKGQKDNRSEVVVAARHDPADRSQNGASAAELTRKQAEAGVEFLRTAGANKIGWWSRRKMTPGRPRVRPPPVPEKDPLPPAYLQVLVFTPQGVTAMAWYAAHAIMYFELTDGPQDKFQVWENVFLVEGTDSQEAGEKACGLARREEGDSSGSLRVGDRPARLVFGGLRKLITVSHERPDDELGDGDEVTYSEFVVSDRAALQRLIEDADTDVEYIGYKE